MSAPPSPPAYAAVPAPAAVPVAPPPATGKGYVPQAAREAQKGYDYVHDLAKKPYFFTYVVGTLLGLTLISALLHKASRRKRRGTPLTLPHSVGF